MDKRPPIKCFHTSIFASHWVQCLLQPFSHVVGKGYQVTTCNFCLCFCHSYRCLLTMLKKIAWTSVLARDISKCNHWTRKHYCWRTLAKRKYPQRNEPAVVCPVRQASVVLLETDTRHMLAWRFQARAKLYLVPSPLQNPLLW